MSISDATLIVGVMATHSTSIIDVVAPQRLQVSVQNFTFSAGLIPSQLKLRLQVWAIFYLFIYL